MNHCCWLRLFLLLLGLMVARPVAPLRGQLPPLPEAERVSGAVVLVADARTGKLLGGVRADQAFQRTYFPGSIFKIAIALAWMQRGGFNSQTEFTCTGHDTVAGTPVRCWLGTGHGKVRFVPAFAGSCNLYFQHIAAGISHPELLRAAKQLGMIGPCNFPGEPIGAPAVPHINVQNLLGESFTVSPAQMLRLALTLATRGRLAIAPFQLSGPRYRPLYQGLRQCVQKGTGKGAWHSAFTVSGKTGTVYRDGTRSRTAGWFVGFAPSDRPRYAVVVLNPNGTGSDAAGIAGAVFGRLM